MKKNILLLSMGLSVSVTVFASQALATVRDQRIVAAHQRWSTEAQMGVAYKQLLIATSRQRLVNSPGTSEIAKQVHADAEQKKREYEKAEATWSTAYYKAAALYRMEGHLATENKLSDFQSMRSGLNEALYQNQTFATQAQRARRDAVAQELTGFIDKVEMDHFISKVERYQ